MTAGRDRLDADETGKASFPASDPPASWTWEIDSAGAEATQASRLLPPEPAPGLPAPDQPTAAELIA